MSIILFLLGKCAGFFCQPLSILRVAWDGGCQSGICIGKAWFTGLVHFFLINVMLLIVSSSYNYALSKGHITKR